MTSIDIIYAIPFLIAFVTLLTFVIIFYRRKNIETNYEKEMRKLRLALLQGKLDRKSFLYVKDNLRVEDLFSEETQRLENMLNEKSIDSETYCRMKKILSMTFNEKLRKINRKYNYTDPKTVIISNDLRFCSKI
jgi:hypothetical protein